MTTQLIKVQSTESYIRWGLVALSAVALFAIPEAHADLAGGLNKAESMATMLRDRLFQIAGFVAAVYLLWKAVQAWQGRCDWGEFAMAVVYVAIAGGSVALAGWAWTALTS